MKKIIYFKEEDDKVSCVKFKGEKLSQIDKKYISEFKLNDKIIKVCVKDNKCLVLLNSGCLIVLSDLKMLKNPVFKHLKNELQSGQFTNVVVENNKCSISLNNNCQISIDDINIFKKYIPKHINNDEILKIYVEENRYSILLNSGCIIRIDNLDILRDTIFEHLKSIKVKKVFAEDDEVYIYLSNGCQIILTDINILNNPTFKYIKNGLQMYKAKITFENFRRTKKAPMKLYRKSIPNSGIIVGATMLAIFTFLSSLKMVYDKQILDEKEHSNILNLLNVELVENNQNQEKYIINSDYGKTTTIKITDFTGYTFEVTVDKDKLSDENLITEIINKQQQSGNSIENEIIRKYADMYFIDYSEARKYIGEHIDEVDKEECFELGVLKCLRELHWADENIDKTPIVSDKTIEEKDRFMLEIANLYGIYDEDSLATLIGINRAETCGTSYAYIHYNNCGGIMDSKTDRLARYKTFEIGAEAFIRCFISNKNAVLKMAASLTPGFDLNATLEENMAPRYNGASADIQKNWIATVREYKQKMIESGLLDDYVAKPKTLKKSN